MRTRLTAADCCVYWAGPDAAASCNPARYSAEDAVRALALRRPAAVLDWQVSRALMQHVTTNRHPADAASTYSVSLSHSRGHALYVEAPATWRVGIDLERIKSRDISAMGKWICSPEEQQSLNEIADQPTRLRAFYMLWTLKEAFVKAASLEFPRDMRSVGLQGGFGTDAKLRPPSTALASTASWHAQSMQLDDFVAALVWQPDDEAASRPLPTWSPGPGGEKMMLTRLDQWSGEHASLPSGLSRT